MGSLEKIVERGPGGQGRVLVGGQWTWRQAWHLSQVSGDQPCLLSVLVGFPDPGTRSSPWESHLFPWACCLREQG